MREVDPFTLARSTLQRWSPSYNIKAAAALAVPVDDGIHFPDPLLAIKQGRFDKNVEIILGTATDENSMCASSWRPYFH